MASNNINITVDGGTGKRDVSANTLTTDEVKEKTASSGVAIQGTRFLNNAIIMDDTTFKTILNGTATTTRNIDFPDADGTVSLYETSTALLTKTPVKAASTVDLSSNATISGSATYNATGGTSGRGQITATLVTTNIFTIDGITLGSADNGTRILLKNQTNAASNGIWTTIISGTSLTLNRATDYDQNFEVVDGVTVWVCEGTVNKDRFYTLTTNNPIIIGGGSGTNLTYARTSYVPIATTKGDIVTSDGTNEVPLAVGANNTVLTADSSTATGLKWGPIVAVPAYYPMTFTNNNTTNSTSYTALGSWIYPGSSALTLTGIKVISFMDVGPTSYDIQLYDVTNGQVIATQSAQTNTVSAIIDMGTLSNIPSGQANFEFQLRRNGGSTSKYIYLLSAQIYNSGTTSFTTSLQTTDNFNWVPFNRFYTSGGTWTTTRIAAANYTYRKSAAAETITLTLDLTNTMRTTTSTGYKLTGWTAIYAVTTAALSSTPTDALYSKTFLNNTSAPTIVSAGGTIGGTSYATTTVAGANFTHSIARTLGSPVYFNTANATLVLEITFPCAASTVLDFYGVMLSSYITAM